MSDRKGWTAAINTIAAVVMAGAAVVGVWITLSPQPNEPAIPASVSQPTQEAAPQQPPPQRDPPATVTTTTPTWMFQPEWEILTEGDRCTVHIKGGEPRAAGYEAALEQGRAACARWRASTQPPFRVFPDYSRPGCTYQVRGDLKGEEHERARLAGQAECDRLMAAVGARRN